MKKFRLSAALLLLALVMALVPATFAQDSTFGASQEDFDLWTAANSGLTSNAASIDFTVSVTGTGLGDSGGDLKADITGTGAFDLSDMENPVLQLDVTGTQDDGTGEKPVNINIRIVDGFVYTNNGDGWKQEPLTDQLSSLTEGVGGVDPSDLSSGDATNMLGDLEQFITLDVSDDAGSRKFALSIDVGGLVASPAITQLIGGAMGMSGGDSSMSTEQVQMMGQQFAALFADASINLEEWVNAETQALNRAVVDINFPLDAMMGPGAGLTLNFDATLSNHGEAVTVEAPEGAEMVESDS